MFGKRTTDAAAPRRVAPQPSAPAGTAAGVRRAQAVGDQDARRAGASRRAAAPPLRRILRREDDGLQRADRHHRSDAARQAGRRLGARRDPRHRQRDHPDQERRHVHRRAGRAARGHLQRRARLWTARAAAGARRHRRHHGQRRQHHVHRSRRQGAQDRRALRRQPAAHEHLPAHRQPGWPPRR